MQRATWEVVDFGLVTNGPMGAVMKAFETIGTAQVAKSAEQARSMGFLGPNDGITMNRDRLLADAKRKVLDLSETTFLPCSGPTGYPGPTGLAGLNLALSDLALSGQATPHDGLWPHLWPILQVEIRILQWQWKKMIF